MKMAAMARSLSPLERAMTYSRPWYLLVFLSVYFVAASFYWPHPRRAVWRRYVSRPEVPVTERAPSSERVYMAPHNGRKYTASVVSMANAAEVYGPASQPRLPLFYESWNRAWPGLRIRLQLSFANHPDLLGYGSLVGHYLAMANTLHYLETHNETCDYHLSFEDDAKPFEGATWPSSSAVNDLDAKLDFLNDAGGNLLLLGGLAFNYDIQDAVLASKNPQGGILHAGHADHAHAYVFKCSAMAEATRFLHKAARQATGAVHTEKLLWDAIGAASGENTTGVHVSVPLMVDSAHGMSSTWNQVMDYGHEGDSRFWENEKVNVMAKKTDYP